MNKILEFDNYVNRGDLKLCLTSGSFFFFSRRLNSETSNNIVVAIFTQVQIFDNFIFENTDYIIRQ